ncbi:MAG TPA: hypothetical protein DF480_03760 [Clostridiales bacterium]|nr:hypothetical protein [Clostridiales bacterium]
MTAATLILRSTWIWNPFFLSCCHLIAPTKIRVGSGRISVNPGNFFGSIPAMMLSVKAPDIKTYFVCSQMASFSRDPAPRPVRSDSTFMLYSSSMTTTQKVSSCGSFSKESACSSVSCSV